jgi:hypothetical protein
VSRRSHKGTLSCVRVHTGDGPGYVKVEIVEAERASVHVVEFRMTLDQFAKAVTGSIAEGTFELLNVDKVGMVREVKTEIVPDGRTQLGEADLAKLEDMGGRNSRNGMKFITARSLEPFEFGGWRARTSDFGNGHRHTRMPDGSSAYAVVFIRFVDATEAAAGGPSS